MLNKFVGAFMPIKALAKSFMKLIPGLGLFRSKLILQNRRKYFSKTNKDIQLKKRYPIKLFTLDNLK